MYCDDKIDEKYNPIILFQKYIDICTVKLDGSEELVLTDSTNWSYRNYRPKFTPNKKNVIFTLDAHSLAQVYIMDLDGANLINLSNTSIDNYFYDISPDGKKILYISTVDSLNSIYMMDINGSNKTCVLASDFVGYNPIFSPSGNRIYFHVYNGTSSFFRYINLDNSEVTNLKDEYVSEPCFSPDGESIIFSSWRTGVPNIYSMDLEGNNEVQLTDVGHCSHPLFSPDGSYIIYSRPIDNNGWSIFRMELDGSNQTLITVGYGLAFTPNGNHLIFQSFEDDGTYLKVLNFITNETLVLSYVNGSEFRFIQVQY